jgi:hypothetical protein
MPRFIKDDYNRRAGKGHPVTYVITIKRYGVLSPKYLSFLKDWVWEYLGDVPRENITIERVNRRRI